MEALAGRPGLTAVEAARRLAEHGRNELAEGEKVSPLRQLLEQFRSPLVVVLLGACGLSAALGEWADAIAIAAIVVANGLVAFYQNSSAERAVQALRSMTAPRARVRRDGHDAVIAAGEVVPGDLVVLEAGDVVAADARLLEASDLLTIEAPLTGESEPVSKSPGSAVEDAPLAERTDTVFLGTSVAAGTALAEVTATGMKTEMGRIATLLATAKQEETPLQKRLDRVGQSLVALCLGVVVLVFVLGLLRGGQLMEVLLSSVSLAVAAVPEGLPAIVTIALAVGVQRMAARNALVRRLPAVETLGCATVICTDKTGTLTTGRMTLRDVWAADRRGLLVAAAACCDAELSGSGPEGVGDPTELALLAAAAADGIRREDLERERPRVATRPFSPERKRMSIRRADGTLYVKGAAETILPRCVSGTAGASAANEEMAGRGLRVLAIATGSGEDEVGLTLLGLAGIADPPRTEAIAAVAAARAAGIRTVMITGDHPVTARAIALEMGIVPPGGASEGLVHARATAEDKLTIIQSLVKQGEIVAMTGDGANDAPALKTAHIGIAMGIAGTEVTREASDMVLADDNFATIVAAIREGRGIFDNIRKTLVYLLAGNVAELLVMLGAALLALPVPLLPIALLWINLVTDGLPALALVMDPAEPDVLSRPPRNPAEPILGRPEWGRIVRIGIVEAAVVLGSFAWALRAEGLVEARDFAFSVLVFSELFRAFAARSVRRTFGETGILSNLRLVGVVALSALLQVALHVVPFTQQLFRLGPVSWEALSLAVAIGLVPVTAVEGTKLVRRMIRPA